MSEIKKNNRFSPNICVTHRCNLNCIYCYQKHDIYKRMSLDTAINTIDWIFSNIPNDMDGVEIGFIGGEPLIEFELLTKIYNYTLDKYSNNKFIFYATTNGTLLNSKMKEWFRAHKHNFVLGLSLDGLPDTHNYNRSNSYDKIDIDFFRNTWPAQGIKMTISEYSLNKLSDNIIYLHSLGFNEINGVNLFEGEFDWSDEKYIVKIIPELKKLTNYYVDNDSIMINQMLNRRIDLCEEKNRQKRKWCGIGTGTIFFDTDGKKLPCPFVTPMTFSPNELNKINNTDFNDNEIFIDSECFNECYIYPVCPTCPGGNYLKNKTFSKRDKSKCRLQKLITIYSADLIGRRIVKNNNCISRNRVYNTIIAIEKIKEMFLPDFSKYSNIM